MLNARVATDYLFYLITAKTRHGTHSPFIYRLVDKVIYDHHAKKVYAEVERGKHAAGRDIKLGRLIYRLVTHFEPESVITIGNGPAIISSYIQHTVPQAPVHISPDQAADFIDRLEKVDVVYFADDGGNGAMLRCFELCLSKVHEDSMLIFADIYKSKEAKHAWAKVKAHPRATATVDMFSIGLVFFKPGQAKEDFKIRI